MIARIGSIVTVRIEQTYCEKYADNLIQQSRILGRIDNYETRLQITHLKHELEYLGTRCIEEEKGNMFNAMVQIQKSLARKKWFKWSVKK